MLNYFYLYAIIWTFVLCLYDFCWADIYAPLHIHLRFFFYTTIFVSVIAGYALRKRFRFYKTDKYESRLYIGTIIILSISFLEFINHGQIPILDVILNNASYTSYGGIKSLHVINATFAYFYCQYLFYMFVCFPKNRHLLLQYFLIVLVVFIGQFHRGGVLINFFMSFLIYSASLKKIAAKHIILFLVTIIFCLYGFGGFGNIRHGYAWNNTSMIEDTAKINNKFPEWLPKQFAWSYVYIICGLGNLNHNIIIDSAEPNIYTFSTSLIPDFISKRIGDDFEFNKPKLAVKTFTVYTGFADSYMNGGVLGLFAFYFVLMISLTLLLVYIKPAKRFYIPYLAIMCSIVSFMFFTNTLRSSGISFKIIYPILTAFKFRPFKQKKGLLEMKK